MSDLASLTAAQNMLTAIAGKHESAALKDDLALASSAISLVIQTMVPRLDPKFDLSGVDAGVAAGLNGFTAAITAAGTPLEDATSTETTANA
ncbi:hypothetical protein [Gluconobacter sphaericus]|uniref:Uncharacterized protein n=1 Tax=Gluconobacter sphaericus NBRC 12467 TaxID=1307951 RepID=A0AA37SL56_9PROT|nr:hypothetical protein [Gluconobacter sphaericus]MBF0885559.1 hypothetical protein [Gluconobacter sphaericus]GBR56547.1 hypothetical protein AA12467_2663 [Gluconobacter sphaericus NBRC 12467]GEB43683.1 hypothetical protein GSP01_24650 [Gluconobacter sphaericus NBRC 12467]GLQ86311.1 hypothetical protein GCM10007872_32260 [Gluconobacter sphaericus NBRC 12467]